MKEAQATDPIDRVALEKIRSLQRPGRPSVLRRVVEAFLGDAESGIERLELAVASRDRELQFLVAHGLKSTSASVGAMRLSELCRILEETTRSGDSQDEPAALEREIVAEYRRVRAALSRELALEE